MSTGFGNQPFGQSQFGGSDWSEEVLFKLIPEFYREEDNKRHGRVDRPLRGTINSFKPLFQELKNKFDDFPSLWDADTVPTDQIPALAYNFGITSATDKDDVFQRLEIINSAQLYQLKGSDKGYLIAASFEGLSLTITPLWAANCEPTDEFFEEGPNQFIPRIDEQIPADEISADSVFNDRFAIWPFALYPIVVTGDLFFDEVLLDTVPLDSSNSFLEPRCRSYSLRLFFEKPDDTEIKNFDKVAERAINFADKMRPAHVVFERITFDGPKAVAYWTSSVDSDGISSSYWTAPITGLLAASYYWTGEIESDIVT